MVIKTSIIMGYECNNNCRFCYCGDKRGKYKSMTTNEIKSELKNGRKRNSTFVDFLGGEPTIRKDLPELISFSKKIGYKTISITTNGRLFSYIDFCEKLINAGLNSAVFSIHGHKPELHDYLTRSPGSFNQAMAGIKNLKNIKKNFYICTNTTIVKQNFRFLPQIAENNIKAGVDALEFIFVHPRGNALKNFDQIVPTLTEVEPFIPKTLKIGKKYNIKHFVFRYFPLCYMKGYEKNLSELTAKEIIQEQHIGPEFEDLNVEENRAKWGRIKGPQCKKCNLYNKCEGIFKEYAERRGFSELKPILKQDSLISKISTQIDFIEILSLINNIKPSILTSVPRYFLPQIELFCKKYNLVFFVREPTRDDIGKDGRLMKKNHLWIVIGKDHEIAEELMNKNYEIKLIGRRNIKRIGELLGYPDCCIKEFIKNENKHDYIYKSMKRSSRFSFYTNNIFNFSSRLKKRDKEKLISISKKNIGFRPNLHFIHLISHIPCSYDCEESVKIGKKTFEIVTKFDKRMAYDIENTLKKPILFFDNFRFLVFNGKANKNYIIYNSISAPHSLLEKELVNKFKSGNKLIVNSEKIKIFHNSRLLYTINKENEMDGFILPFG